ADHKQRPAPEHAQLRWPCAAQPLGQARRDDVRARVPGERLRLEQREQLVAVALAPPAGIGAHEELHVAAAKRVVPTSTIRRSPASESASAAAPAAVNRYGRRRSSAPSGSISPRSSRRVIAP